MTDLDAIRVGNGLGCLVFGMSRNDVRRQLGDPEQEEQELSAAEAHFVWHYWTEQISLYFEGEDGYRRDTISCDRHSCKLNGSALIGNTMDQIRSLVKELKLGSVNEKLDYLEYEGRISLIQCTDACLNFWFKDGVECRM